VKRDRRELRHGDRVAIDANVGDDESGSLRGCRGTVHGVNPTYQRKNGETMVNLQLEDGAVVAVPSRAVKVRRG